MDTDYHESAVEPYSQSVGTILRSKREFAGISLKEAAEATRISKKYLQALEDDRLQALPSLAYMKGFLKTYADYLELDGEVLIRQCAGAVTPLADAPESVARTSGWFNNFDWQRMFLPAVLLGALIISAFLLSPSSPERPVPPPVSQKAMPEVVPVATVAAVQHVISSAVKPAVAEPPPAPQASLLAETIAVTPKPLDGFVVRMKVINNSTLTVTIDDSASQGYELTNGDIIEWKAARTIALDFSDAGGVEMELNNNPLKLQAPPGKQLYIVLDANGIRK